MKRAYVIPKELSLLHGLLARACQMQEINRDSPEAQSMAIGLLAAFRGGVVDEERLLNAAISSCEVAQHRSHALQ